MKKTLITLLAVQVIVILGFLYFGWQADAVMDKQGIGNMERHGQLSGYTGIAFYSAVGLWLVTLIVSLSGKVLNKTEGQLAVGLPPILGAAGWALLMVL